MRPVVAAPQHSSMSARRIRNPARFTVVIWIENRPKFSLPPEQLYAAKTICVTGMIQAYRGSPEIIVFSPDQIRAV